MDFGSAYGGACIYVASKYGCKVTGVDISLRENARARELAQQQDLSHLIQIKDKSFCDTDEADGLYDVVISEDSLLHAGNLREKAVEEAARLLKPGGRFVFTDLLQVGMGI